MKKIYSILSVFLILGQMIFAQNVNSVKESNKYSLKIKFYNKTMYYPENPESNPIFIQVSIKNTSNETLRFKLADDRAFSLDFNVYTIQNKKLQETEKLKIKRTSDQTVYFREIALETVEEYSFVENLKDYIVISEPSIYYFDLNFYPELYKSKFKKLSSNRLTLEINPELSAASSSSLPVKAKTAELLVPEEIAPDKVVEQTIIARQKSLWDQYFLYIDVEAMLKRNPSLERKYNSSNAEDQAKMIQAFKTDLMQNKIENDIVAIPERFEIKKTTYDKTSGTVEVIQWFKYPTFSQKKKYLYQVRQHEGIWKIVDYSVTNLGTE